MELQLLTVDKLPQWL